MRYSKRQMSLLISAGLLSVVMTITVPALTVTLPVIVGYLGVFCFYWIFFCIPIAVIYGKGDKHVGYNLSIVPYWVPAIALGLPICVFFSAGTPAGIGGNAHLLALSIGVALLNGTLEELAWRRTFRANSGGRISFELLGLFFFTLWHVPLYFSKGVTFDHGAFGLIGGAMMLGAVWMVITRKSNSVGWPVVSHILVNIAAFTPMFIANFSNA